MTQVTSFGEPAKNGVSGLGKISGWGSVGFLLSWAGLELPVTQHELDPNLLTSLTAVHHFYGAGMCAVVVMFATGRVVDRIRKKTHWTLNFGFQFGSASPEEIEPPGEDQPPTPETRGS
ncbi:hypothetical protein ETD83_18090 [Actinomadura soli]|uniref:Uncharacterized protein n=1 Tax=Actinomadura soli TaxID=2508997 RepID=A0A5C4JB13_9ACTN|nr:hypothetical protein [Actinomadura soli]TMQ99263.1 hypothetical protein ETD83_18090 [Actinomadura soli]